MSEKRVAEECNRLAAMVADLRAENARLTSCISDETIRREMAEASFKTSVQQFERVRVYAVQLAELLSEARGDVAHQAEISDHAAGLLERIDAALAKNPNPAGHLSPEASDSPGTEASGAGGAGTDKCIQCGKFRTRAWAGEAVCKCVHETWQHGDPYPWIVREPSGQCWGPFATNKAASQWADDNQIATCDFEDVMPPPDSRHQSCTQPCPDCGRQPPGPHCGKVVQRITNVDELRIDTETLPACCHQVCNVPKGWALMPIEPTQDMLDAGYSAVGDSHYSPTAEKLTGWRALAKHVYATMIDAAPDYEFVAGKKS